MIGPPSWLYYLFGVLMLAVAAYCLWEIVNSLTARLKVGLDVEISHVFMGLAMAGMFVPQWTFGPSAIWVIIFLALLVWFLVGSIQSIQRYGLHVPHHAIHAVMSFAMLLMYWFPAAAGGGATSMSMSAHGARMDPGLAFLVALVLFGSAIFTIASPNRGATHFGTHGPEAVPGRSPAAVASDGEASVAVAISLGESRLIAADATHVIMCVAMGFMLILMI